MKDRENSMRRREFLAVSGAATAGLAAGCATNPVTGKKQTMFISRAKEVDFDRKWAPQQFSADYGAVQDAELNAYVSKLGQEMSQLTHRPSMPYNFRVLNTVVVNGYTMPAGSIGLARGLMLEFQNEAQLAAVIGHELGHVNHRHAGERMTKKIIANVIIAAGAAYLEYKDSKYTDIAAGLGMIGANALLFKYSRDDEREADEVGMEYAARAGHNPKGMSETMEIFMKARKSKPSALEVLFSTHPLSSERYETCLARYKDKYKDEASRSLNRERYMDNTAKLRSMRKAIDLMQRGEKSMMAKKYTEAEQHYAAALVLAPSDYAGLLMMSKCMMARGKQSKAREFIKRARDVYPQEHQALHLAGMVDMKIGKYADAIASFSSYERRLPGNPNTIFYQGLCNEKLGRKAIAASHYLRYRKSAPAGEYSGYSNARLVNWGFIQPPQPKGQKK